MNPTLPPGKKVAAALRYEQGSDRAPRLVASGRGAIAERILELAREAGIAIREDAALAQMLLQVPAGQEIPAEMYEVVAELLAAVYRAEQAASNNSGSRQQ